MAYIDTGLGWYLDEDYLLTVGNQQLCTIATGGGGGGGGAPLSPNTQYTDTDLSKTNVFQIGEGNPVWIEISNVTSRVYWMYIQMPSYYSGDTIWAVAAVSKAPFSISMTGWQDNPYPATKPPSSPAQRYIETLRGFSSWTDVYGIVIGYHGTAYSGSDWFTPNSWSGDIPKLFHESVSGTTVIDTGLGWYADPLYLMQNAGITGTLTPNSSPQTVRELHKAYDGFCLAFRTEVSGFIGTCIVSTVEQYATGYGTPDWTTPSISGSTSYLGLTWYCYRGPWLAAGEGTLSSGLPYVSANSNSIYDLVKAVVDAAAVTTTPASTTKVATKVQGGAGAFAVASYPHDGNTVHVAVGISSIGNPNSAATVALDGTNGNYNTFNREGMEFTMYYTSQEAGTLTANVPEVVLDTDISALPGLYKARLFLAVADAAQIHVGEYDPYSGAGESEPGAEEATFDFDSAAIDFGSPPTITAAGMVELYIPSTSNLASLAQYLWAGSFDPDNFKKLFADPMDAIIGLQIVPVTATEIGTTPDTLYVGNISTGLSMPKASRQYVPVDCGSLSIPRRLGSYLDYSPHTEMQLYLPYIGFVDISPDDCMGGTVSVKYMVDIIGGTCVAQVKCNDHVLYEYAAACSCQVPVSAGQYQNIVLGAVRGGIGLVSGILGAAGGGLFSGLSEAADAAMSMTKPKIQRSGGFGGSSGLMGHQTPYIIYTVPRLIVPGRQNNFIGYPSYITRTLGDLTGFTQIDSIHLSGIPASQSEQAEIEQLLQEGVYL